MKKTNTSALVSAALAALLVALGTGETSAVTIDWVPVGNPGNANDRTGFGAVPYAFSIDKYDVTNNQYVEFLNAKDPAGANTLGLYNSLMSTYGGINSFNGIAYTVVSGRGNHPVNFVTWYDAIRFANWLNNGQGNGDTESGAYIVLGGTPTPRITDSIERNRGAKVFLPSEDEWYKAAYNIPGTNSYYLYATSSNLAPTASGPTATPNSANYDDAVGNLTDVGAYTGTTSPYGAFDMNGNVSQFNEALIFIGGLDGVRGARGGSFGDSLGGLQSSTGSDSVLNGDMGFGFRVASLVPEPSTAVLAIIACGMMWWCRKWLK